MADYFDTWFWATNLTSNTCEGAGSFTCQAPNACARDPNTGKRYCCNVGQDAVCWSLSSPCSTDGKTFECGSGSTKWCCLNNREDCTQTAGQVNICWSSAYNTLRNISVAALSSARLSVSAARPSASSLTFDPVSLIALTASPSSSSTSKSSASTTTTGSSSSATTPTDPAAANQTSAAAGPDSPALGSGAIAGVAVGAVAALAIFAAGVFLLWRRRNKREKGSYGGIGGARTPTQSHHSPSSHHAGTVVTEMSGSSPAATVWGAYGKVGGGGYRGGVELSGETHPVELPSQHAGWEAKELHGYAMPHSSSTSNTGRSEGRGVALPY